MHILWQSAEILTARFAASAFLLVACWAVWLQFRLYTIRLEARRESAMAQSALRLRDAVLAHSRQSFVVLGAGVRNLISVGGGAGLLTTGLAGRDRSILAAALNALITDGTPFEVSVRIAAGTCSVIEGWPIQGRAVVLLKQSAARDAEIDYRAALEMLAKISTAIALFDGDGRLMHYNPAYARLWPLPAEWLDLRPTQGEILDRLHEQRLVPEQRDFAVWKRHQLSLFSTGDRCLDDFWHMPSGLSLHVMAQRHLPDGLLFIFEDVSEVFQLRSALSSHFLVQKAMVDAIEDAVAIFEPDGRVAQYNQLFAKLWRLTPAELSQMPHFTMLASLSAARIGRDAVWDIVASAVTSMNPERYSEWGTVKRTDGVVISLTLLRLPNGSTLVTFHDVTNIGRFQAGLAEKSGDAA
jgi:PAS domain-containing protein